MPLLCSAPTPPCNAVLDLFMLLQIWLIILRYMAGVMAWLTILLVNLALIGFTLYCFVLAGKLGSAGFREVGGLESLALVISHSHPQCMATSTLCHPCHLSTWHRHARTPVQCPQKIADALPNVDPTDVERDTWLWIGIASAIVAGIVLLLTLLMISRVRVAVACIKVASQAVGSMPSIMLFPLLPFVLVVAMCVYWVAIAGLLYSAGDLTTRCRSPDTSPYSFIGFPEIAPPELPTDPNCYKDLPLDVKMASCGADPNCRITYKWNDKLMYAFIYHFFGLLWTNQFIVGYTLVTIAGAISNYYWSRGDSSQMPTFPVLTALKNTTVYHMGSVAFGSFIIAVIQLIRFLLEYLDRKTKELQAANKCAAWALCCCKCCMWCLEKIVAFINRNAYIMVAVKGTSYCVSAGRAVALLVSNALRLAAVNFVGDMLIFLGKVAVAAAAGIVALAMCELNYYNDPVKHPDTYLYSPILPVAISIITAFAVASVFFAVYEMAIDTILLSFCEDCEVNNGEPRFAPPLLMEVVGGSGSAHKGNEAAVPRVG